MKKLMNFFLLSCKKSSFLIEKEHDNPLSFIDKLQLSMHLKICDKCASYKQQSSLIEDILKSNRPVVKQKNVSKLTEASKTRMQESINKLIKNT